MKVDYLLIGQGIAGSFTTLEIVSYKKSICVIDANVYKASSVAAGIVNPVVLFRFTPIWQAQAQIDILQKKRELAKKVFSKDFYEESPVYRIIYNEIEAELWRKKAQSPQLDKFLSQKIIQAKDLSVIAPHGLGKVKQTGRWNFTNFMQEIKKKLEEKKAYRKEHFIYKDLTYNEGRWVYKDISAKHILFAEGMNVKQNPYFTEVPIYPVKGESILVKAERQKDKIYKSTIFLCPWKGNLFYVGSSHEPKNTDTYTSASVVNHLLQLSKEMTGEEMLLQKTMLGFRPSLSDYKPVVGMHPRHKNMSIINGMGSRGALTAAFCAEKLIENIEKGKEIDPEIHVNRFF